jgi:hypothetical protein
LALAVVHVQQQTAHENGARRRPSALELGQHPQRGGGEQRGPGGRRAAARSSTQQHAAGRSSTQQHSARATMGEGRAGVDGQAAWG